MLYLNSPLLATFHTLSFIFYIFVYCVNFVNLVNLHISVSQAVSGRMQPSPFRRPLYLVCLCQTVGSIFRNKKTFSKVGVLVYLPYDVWEGLESLQGLWFWRIYTLDTELPLHHIQSLYILTFENVLFFLQKKHPFANRPLIDWIALRIVVQQQKISKASSLVPLNYS